MSSRRALSIGRVRARLGAETADRVAVRLRLSSLLATADLQPEGMPPAAVLIVRRAPDPLPGRLSVRRPAARVDSEWERATREALHQAWRQAARPAEGPVPASATAVAFADEAEMVAELAVDLAKGVAGERWWWQSVHFASPGSGVARLTAILRERAAIVPAVLHHLSERGKVTEVLTELSPEAAKAVRVAVSRAYALDESAPDWRDRGIRSGEPPLAADSRQRDTRRAASDAASARGAADDAGLALGPEPLPGGQPLEMTLQRLGSPERAALLLLGLALHERPAALRSRPLSEILARWLTWPARTPDWRVEVAMPAERPAATGSRPPEGPGSRLPAGPAPGPRPNALDRRRDEPGSSPRTGGEEAPSVPGSSAPRAAHGDEGEANADHSSDLTGPLPDGRRSRSDGARPSGSPTQVVGDLAPTQAQTTTASADAIRTSWSMLEEGVETGLGGVLFLINVMLRLDLPGRFEADWRLATAVGAWGTLDLLGRGLLADDQYAEHDPLWTVLAALAGRPVEDLPGAGLSDVAEPRWPGEPPGGPSVLASSGSFRLTSSSPLVVHLSGPAQRWLALALRGVRRWLEVALASRGDGEPADLGATLLRRRGRLYLTATHVDLAMRLDDVSVPARLAGLDLDPGWVPDFGRVVRFHYD